MCLKQGNKEILLKIIEVKDYMSFHGYSELEFDIDWRKDRQEEKL